MATHFRYRKNGGEVVGASTEAVAPWPDDTYFGVLTDPTIADGIDIGIPKRWDGTEIRNATPGEVNQMATRRDEDNNLQMRDAAKNFFDNNPLWRKLLRSIVAELAVEIDNRIASNPRNAAQIRTAIFSRIDGGSND